MSIRSALSLLVAASLVAVTVACNGAPKPRPRGPGDEPRPNARSRTRPGAPRPPAPRGPDLSGAVTLSFELDGLERLDRRIIAVLPPMFARLARGQALRRMVPGIARKIGISALALDALDHKRASAFALMITRKGKSDLRIRMVAALPIRGDGKLVIDGIKASYDSTTDAPWGGLEIRQNGETVAWVRVHKGWAIVAPTAPLLDSAYRYLVPRARDLPAGHARAHLNARALVRVVKPLVTQMWRRLGPNPYRALGGSVLGRWLSLHGTDIEKIGAHLASLDRVSLEVQAHTTRWTWRLDVTPKKGSPLARRIAGQKEGAGFGLKVLPPKPFAALSDWVAPDLRSFVFRLLSTFTGMQLDRLTKRLPRQVALRGLYKRKRPASYLLYRKTLRDLNLQDYRKSHQVYLMLWHVHAFRRHLKKALPPLVKTHTGKTAAALYATDGPGLGYAAVMAIKDPRRHLRLYKNALWGTLRSLNRLVRSAWRVMPKGDRRLFGQRPFFQFIFRQNAARVGRIPVSAVALRIKWPQRPRGKLTYEQERAHRTLARYQTLVETVLGTGDLTWAWAYVGKRALVSAGRDWKPRILGMVKAALGKGGPTLDADPLFTGVLKPPAQGKRLGLVLFSSTRLVSALMRGLFKLEPRAKRSMELAILNRIIQQDAKRARTGTLLEVLRRRGGYRIQSVLPRADVRSLLMSVGYVFYGTMSSSRSYGPGGPMKKPSLPHPPTPKQPLHHP